MEFTGFQRADGSWVPLKDVKRNQEAQWIEKSTDEPVREISLDADAVEKSGDSFALKEAPEITVASRAFKMSKSRGNVVNPDEIVRDFGADALRLYEMFMGPLEATKPWSMAGVNGVRNFLDRVWRMIVDDRSEQLVLHETVRDVEPDDEQNRVLHRTIMAVTADTETMSFNTAIARMMEFVNFFTKQSVRPKSAMERLVLLLSPYAPHIAEELWQILGHDQTLAYESWPAFDEALTKEDTIEIPVQIKGKVRSKIQVAAEATREEMEAAARADERIQGLIGDKQILKVIVVPGRLVNFVVK
jgi:leucyl-tRNA synthetase